MKKRQLIVGLLVLVALVALFLWGREKFHFDFDVFRRQVAQADWHMIALGAGCIYVAYVFRALRWALLLRPTKHIPPFSLLGTQVIGFTAVALIGRVADPVRPYLVAKRTGLPISSQLAVYVVERLFDAGSMALIFSVSILLTPASAFTHPEIVKRAGEWGMLLTVAGSLFLVAIRLAGGVVASFFEHTFGLVSKRLGAAIGDKIRTFRAGLDTMRTFGDFCRAAGLSIAMWFIIALAYLWTVRAFVASPELASMSWARCMLLLALSGTVSALQLPVIGWFTQIGFVAAALTSFYGAAPEAATACAATLLLATFLCVVPVGLIWAQFEHVSLRKITHDSEHIAEDLPRTTTSVAE